MQKGKKEEGKEENKIKKIKERGTEEKKRKRKKVVVVFTLYMSECTL